MLPPMDDRVVLHFDYDCFYAQVVQRHPPPGCGWTAAELADRPVGVTQKSILATCNYVARRRGVRKLMRIADARRVLPELVLIGGEDLSPFRDASKALYAAAQKLLPPGTAIERLGLDEVFVDATALVDANADRMLLRAAGTLGRATFVVDAVELLAFDVDCLAYSGSVVGQAGPAVSYDALGASEARQQLRLVLGSHLAAFLRARFEALGYTSSAGIATNKVLAKLAGKMHKPAAQTVVAGHVTGVVAAFMDALPLRSVPGIGHKTASLLEAGVTETKPSVQDQDHDHDHNEPVTVGRLRTCPGMSPQRIDTILGSAQSTGAAGSALPSGARVWALLHGTDDLPVRGGRDHPAQISIEDTYAGPRQGSVPPTAAAVAPELRRLTAALLRRVHVDLVDQGRLKVRPRTLRLALRPQFPDAVAGNRVSEKSYHFARVTRSTPLPSFFLSLSLPADEIVERLVQNSLVPMFRLLAAGVRVPIAANRPGRTRAWTVGLLNVCVTNMAPVADGGGIAALLRKDIAEADASSRTEMEGAQREGALAERGRAQREGALEQQEPMSADAQHNPSYYFNDDDDNNNDNAWDADAGAGGKLCTACAQHIPVFALAAHARFHLMGDD